jgi:hypothetical protein
MVSYRLQEGGNRMEISSAANQALYLRDQMNNTQLGVAALKQSANAEQQVANMLAKNAASVAAPQESEKGGFSTYA